MDYTNNENEKRKTLEEKRDEYIEFITDEWSWLLGEETLRDTSKEIVKFMEIDYWFMHQNGWLQADSEWRLDFEKTCRNNFTSFYWNRPVGRRYQYLAELFSTLDALDKIGVKNPAVIVLLNCAEWLGHSYSEICAADVERYVSAHGAKCVANILNQLTKYSDFWMRISLEDVFFNKEYPNPYDAISEITGAEYCENEE